MLKTMCVPKSECDFGPCNLDIINNDFIVKINGVVTTVYNNRCSAIPFNRVYDCKQRDIFQSEILGMVSFESDNAVNIEVECKKPFKNAIIRPISKKVITNQIGSKVKFTLSKKGQYVLEFDNEHIALNFFFNEINNFSNKDKYTYYFGPGIHNIGVLSLKSNDKVYIDKDSILLGAIYGENINNILVEGYGQINSCTMDRVAPHMLNRGNIMFVNCENIKIDGVILQDSSMWVCSLYNCSNVKINNIKITGQWRFNTDGIDIVSCKNIDIKNSFIHAFDDVITLKGYSLYKKFTIDTVENIHVDNCVMWCGWGRTIEIGIESYALEFKNIIFENCDLIHNSAVCIDFQNGNCAHYHDIEIKNCNIEYQSTTLPEIYQEKYEQVYDGYGKLGFPYFIWMDNHAFPYFFNKIKEGDISGIRELYADKLDTRGLTTDIKISNINIFADDGLPKFKIYIKSINDIVFDNIFIDNIYINNIKQNDISNFDVVVDNRIKNIKIIKD